jgi:hypothetical protein
MADDLLRNLLAAIHELNARYWPHLDIRRVVLSTTKGEEVLAMIVPALLPPEEKPKPK